ncbi:MAG: M20/M25/M40 family metallo-hydrolase [Rhizobiaceae bacterium]|nr:M20/M25/M40 family metallo-hydrolase [Rhizobiaceae bacterium]
MTTQADLESSADNGRAVAFLRDLIAAQPKGENAVQALISDRLSQAGCEVTSFDYEPSTVPVVGELIVDGTKNVGTRRAIVATLNGDAALPSLLMFAHPDGEAVADTETWSHDPFAGDVDAGRLYGWGVADDLAGCAAAVLAIEKAAASNSPMGRAVFASTPSKHYARGVAALLHDGLSADASLYLHPAESGVGMREIKAVASGQVEFKITIHGKAPNTTEPVHTTFSHLSANPIDKAFVLHQALTNLAEERAKRIHHPLIEAEVGRATNLHISGIRCGEMRKFSKIVETCEMGGAISFPPGETLEQIQKEVEGAIVAAAKADEWLASNPPEITWVTGVTGAEISAEHPLYQTASQAVTAVTGEPPHVNPMHTCSDIRNPMIEAGIPCVGLGCLGGDLSQNGKHDEWVDLPDFLRMVDVTANVVTSWCGGKRVNQT